MFATFPIEILGEIASHVSKDDIMTLRVVSKGFRHACMPRFGAIVSEGKALYPTRKSVVQYVKLANDKALAPYIKSIRVVGETFHNPTHGSDWAWSQFASENQIKLTPANVTAFHHLINVHEYETVKALDFILLGRYRSLMAYLFRRLTHLKSVYVQQKLGRTQHVPGWAGTKLLGKITGYHAGMNTKWVLYGDWNSYEDETGDVIETGVSFKQDLLYAVDNCGRALDVFME
ncbi:hypothetical protein BDV95DRAFT_573993 [Massariosphaeria phaeospora]|uniref:F-box domain-containing protein n=1 Tax=Massariosphaeria phaeospora TaxID=100035 RepID=A0A7C8I6H2_9PLEO|nr:hypothetical protein BDV95DRAFT_573993 [Massariosphaeria phaeospora]